jgi:hypothetical protein
MPRNFFFFLKSMAFTLGKKKKEETKSIITLPQVTRGFSLVAPKGRLLGPPLKLPQKIPRLQEDPCLHMCEETPGPSFLTDCHWVVSGPSGVGVRFHLGMWILDYTPIYARCILDAFLTSVRSLPFS